ncbi:MAG: hypoxanthine phosphoribosyltransferase [Thermodesulfobacteriota bacterium]|nr:hypoxanthine phosphoribosyltransferase [Thermodesulfobacteriota bacterium]
MTFSTTYNYTMEDENLILLYSKEEIDQKITDIASQITKDYQNNEVILIGILKGAFVFLADLMRNIRIPLKVDFVRLSSYGSKLKSSGKVMITKDIDLSIEGKDVLIVEDILDSGFTLSFLFEKLKAKNPKSLKSCVLINKTERQEKRVEVDYVAFRLEEGYVVGYGLDCDERYRNLPDIYKLSRRKL